MIDSDKKMHLKEIAMLKEQIEKLQISKSEAVHSGLSLNRQESFESRTDSVPLSLDLSKSVSERQEGEVRILF